MDLKHRLTVWVVLIAWVWIFTYLVRQMCSGAVWMPTLIIAGFTGFFLLLLLGDKFWRLIPFSMVSQLGVIPIGNRTVELAEIAIPACFVFLLLRSCMNPARRVRIAQAGALGLLLYMAWVVMAYCMHPTGFLFVGSTTFGARSYYKILVAFLAYVVMSNVSVEERDCKWIVWMIIVGGMVWSSGFILQNFRLLAATGDSGEFYKYQTISGPALILASLLFVKYKAEGVVSKPWRLMGYAACIGIALASGKRMGLLGVASVPIVQVLLDRRGYRCLVKGGLGGLVALVVLVQASHADLLPRSVQRALANVPGMKLDREVYEQTRDDYRAYLRHYAWERIKENPLFGLKGFAMDYDTAASLLLLHRGGEKGIEGAAYTRNWHSTWLGMAADFGVPLVFFWGIFFVHWWKLNLRCYRQAIPETWLSLLCGYMMINLAITLTRSMTSDDALSAPYNAWWQFGLLVSVSLALARQKEPLQKTPEKNEFPYSIATTGRTEL